MSKRMLSGLVLLALTVIVLLLNGQGAAVRFPGFEWKLPASFAYLFFAADGVAIGMLLR